MADDIDILLDEVEEKYLNDTAAKSKTEIISSDSSGDSSIADIVNDICHNVDNLDAMITAMPLPCSDKKFPTSIESEQRCFPVYLSGSSITTGQASARNKWACSNLRCLNCDFKVTYFDDFEWSNSTDYLFLRNHMPDLASIKSNLIARKGSRAYGCQCSWKNVQRLMELKTDLDLKWTCGKH